MEKGWGNSSKLNDGNYHYVRNVDRVADDLRIQLTIQEDPEKAALKVKINALEAKLKEKDEIIASQGAYIESLENGASSRCSNNVRHTKSSAFYGGDSNLDQMASQKKLTPSYLGIFASVKPPFESSSESEGGSPGTYSPATSSWGGGSYGD